MSASQRRKGASYEREVARMFRERGIEAHRGLQSRAGTDAPDVDIERFWVECKRGAKPNPRAALAQAIADTDGRTPVAVIRDDRAEAFVVMRLADFLDMVEKTNDR